MKSQVVRIVVFFTVLILSASAGAADVQMKDLVVGTGKEAGPDMQVQVHYTGWLMNGDKFDSSLDRKQPFVFTLGAHQVIEGWDKGVQGMKVGGKRELVIPPELAYGPRGAGGVIPPNATLRFEVDLLDVMAPLFQSINNDELKALMKEGVKLVDIRTPKEWKETGIIEGSLLLPFKMSKEQVNPKFVEDMQRIAKPDEKVILICRSGNRSRTASEGLSSRFGYSNIYNVKKGIKHWMAEKNPTVNVNMDDAKTTCSVCK
ncbi:MAG: FKBP-type peptidyl-prolyl cis-trans isomerase [Methylocystaceae bacterium]|nr:FKBP-type peptidyl-prolyl cis-trans isomerase [Methylocystaceae bacterium]